jgi:hypothetical protein
VGRLVPVARPESGELAASHAGERSGSSVR